MVLRTPTIIHKKVSAQELNFTGWLIAITVALALVGIGGYFFLS